MSCGLGRMSNLDIVAACRAGSGSHAATTVCVNGWQEVTARDVDDRGN